VVHAAYPTKLPELAMDEALLSIP